jgi:hypothetical protein
MLTDYRDQIWKDADRDAARVFTVEIRRSRSRRPVQLFTFFVPEERCGLRGASASTFTARLLKALEPIVDQDVTLTVTRPYSNQDWANMPIVASPRLSVLGEYGGPPLSSACRAIKIPSSLTIFDGKARVWAAEYVPPPLRKFLSVLSRFVSPTVTFFDVAIFTEADEKARRPARAIEVTIAPPAAAPRPLAPPPVPMLQARA